VEFKTCCDIILHTMSLIDVENTEWQISFGFYPVATQKLLDESGMYGESMLQQTPQLVNIPIEELRKRIGILSASTEVSVLTPNTAKAYVMLDQRRLGQLATLAVSNDLTETTLAEINSSPIGINAEVLLRHIDCTIKERPYDRFILGKRDEQLLLSALQYSQEQEDTLNVRRIEQTLAKVKKSSGTKPSNIVSFKQSTLSI